MKIIHCADLHLDSKMNANLSADKAKERKAELLNTFVRMLEYASEYDVEAVLIAGDMFDTKNISATTKNTILSNIKKYSHINFYYLKGNHDFDNFLSGVEVVPENLKLFSSSWRSYEEGDIVITGLELSKDNNATSVMSLMLDPDKFNIVMLHGQESMTDLKDNAEVINIKGLKGKFIDYLALGHIHSYKEDKIDARGTYCYPGCLEGRGFDECGEHGFVLLDIDAENRTYTHKFVPFAYRKIYTVSVDVSGANTSDEMIGKIDEVISGMDISNDSLVKIVLTGDVDVECEKDMDYILSKYRMKYYFAKIYDETHLLVNVEDFLLDESLKGEFVRQVMGDDSISDEDKKRIIRYGLEALNGEEVL